MASSSGNSSFAVNSSGSEMDERKRKRMQSNRESARRSRMRKQQHLDELAAQAAQLRRDNAQIAASVGVTARHLSAVEAENSVLRAQMAELAHRLQSLNDIVGYINGCGTTTVLDRDDTDDNHNHNHNHNHSYSHSNSAGFAMNNAASLVNLSQPIMANASDMFLY